jgi:hypothetical protein
MGSSTFCEGVFVLSDNKDFLQLISHSAEEAVRILRSDEQKGEGPWRYRGNKYDEIGSDELDEWFKELEEASEPKIAAPRDHTLSLLTF